MLGFVKGLLLTLLTL